MELLIPIPESNEDATEPVQDVCEVISSVPLVSLSPSQASYFTGLAIPKQGFHCISQTWHDLIHQKPKRAGRSDLQRSFTTRPPFFTILHQQSQPARATRTRETAGKASVCELQTCCRTKGTKRPTGTTSNAATNQRPEPEMGLHTHPMCGKQAG
eukprot:jgi/Botrbrau1/8393/Bobra.0237s0014.1